MNICHINPHLRFATALRYAQAYNNQAVMVTDCRLFYVLEGTATLHIGQLCYQLTPNSLFYCRAGSCYTICTEGFQLISLNFDLTQAHNREQLPFSPSHDPARWETLPVYRDSVADSSFLNAHLVLDNAEHLLPQLETVVAEFSGSDRFSRELSGAALKTLLIQLHRQDQQELPPKIALVRDHIQRNYAQPLTNRELSRLAGYHEYYLNRIFTDCVGLSLHEYLLKVRLTRASYLMLNTDLELQDICEQVGFRSYPHFSSYFKQRFGQSPAAYRKRLKAGI